MVKIIPITCKGNLIDDINLNSKLATPRSLIDAMFTIFVYSKQLISLLVAKDTDQIDPKTNDLLVDKTTGRVIYTDLSESELLEKVKISSKSLLNSSNKLYYLDKSLLFTTNEINMFRDVNEIDEELWNKIQKIQEYKFYIIVKHDLFGNYIGHVWAYHSYKFPDLIGIYAIQKSPCRNYKGLSYELLDGVRVLARQLNVDTIIVPWPLETMRYVLTKIGFIEHNDYSHSKFREFLKPISQTYNYFLGAVLPVLAAQ
jgi:hypothetical protein